MCLWRLLLVATYLRGTVSVIGIQFSVTSSVSWESICLRKEYGGLGVRQLKEFNLSLLGKWCWRMLVDREGLRFRVLATRYGMEGGRLREGGRRGSSWWREIVWLGRVVSSGVAGLGSMFRRGWEIGRIRFSGPIPGWTGLLCVSGLDTFMSWRRPNCERLSLQTGGSGSLTLMKATLSGALYQLLTSHDSTTTDEVEKLIWHPQVPLKVSIFAWRLLRDRLPTKINLVTRGILTPAAHLCVSGCGVAESAHHLFISCSTSGSLWALVHSWIGITVVDSTSLCDHFVQFTSSAGGSWAHRPFMQLIWLACI
ncbi:hypothetical protein TSUD_302560 [Trifolium subterraneum]|uniref:Reverse transcriptase zinc-binding domain-containing protein n=1 Tax=Trifolium subterraneum TaxID=3900 RepID=A0A2Z6PD64_TRISU|nr:hypothetical protein TSUD_302560 [Trifolium subterraneum]